MHPISRHVSYHLSPTKTAGSTASTLFPAPVRRGDQRRSSQTTPLSPVPPAAIGDSDRDGLSSAGCPHAKRMSVMRPPHYRATRQGLISVLQQEFVLEESNEGLIAGQSLLTREQEMTCTTRSGAGLPRNRSLVVIDA